ncbi:type I polyketide synthase [Microbacterium sp.]|uniref:type I polyketide synthase n=1 Tax=Microbacterium sp. TaxID=51671 RepID=UPI0026301752|nr:type I polyketide synthase [Microbacterium sp.]
MSRILDLTDVALAKGRPDTGNARQPIAIVGMAGRAGRSRDLAQFWQLLRDGEQDFTRIAGQRRDDVEDFLAARGTASLSNADLIGGARLPSVADFDHRFFGMSRQEARMLDPNQRIFLQTAWEALEDAGHLGQDVRGQRIGVYVGMSSDFGHDYRSIVQASQPRPPEAAVAGNVRSIIASRLSYLLDFSGPAMLIDTACSSGLVAIYTAMRALQSGECTMAVVGGVKCDLVPVIAQHEGVGVVDIAATEAADHRTRTFDRRSDGTTGAEGAFAFVLKRLDHAERDGDTVRAVVLGGAVNQDGTSNGITAPDAAAQAELIQAALADAETPAERISYVEAHGTATRLGDPIEISGITRAFGARSSRQQFCAVGTVKTNVGHMDNAAGLAGLAKVVLSMQHRELPASLNFREPNPQIDFVGSPLYVNDRATAWDDERHLHAGISSFGLSGTNCHLIVRSADAVTPGASRQGVSRVLPLSAQDDLALGRLAQRYVAFLESATIDADDMVYTAGVGRTHHSVRAGIVFDDHDELLDALRCLSNGYAHPAVSRGSFRVVLRTQRGARDGDLTEAEHEALTRRADSHAAQHSEAADRETATALAEAYARGGDVDFRRAHAVSRRRIALPTYPFEDIHCWVPRAATTSAMASIVNNSILVSAGRAVAVHRLDAREHWLLSDHRVQGVSVLPGTGLIDLVLSAASALSAKAVPVRIRRMVFEEPVTVEDAEPRELHIHLDEREVDAHEHEYDVRIVSRGDTGEWTTHVRAELEVTSHAETPEALDLAAIRDRLSVEVDLDDDHDVDRGLVLGSRWTDGPRSGRTNATATEYLFDFALPPQNAHEIDEHLLHPALLDLLVNATNNLTEDAALYLPFSYGELQVYGRLPARAFAHFIHRPESVEKRMHVFDVIVTDAAGAIVLTAERYCITAVRDQRDDGYGHLTVAKRIDAAEVSTATPGGRALVIGRVSATSDALVAELERRGMAVTRVLDPVDAEDVATDAQFALGYFVPLADERAVADASRGAITAGLDVLDLIATRRVGFEHGLAIITRGAYEIDPAADDASPGHAAVGGLFDVAATEFRELGIRLIDIDSASEAVLLVDEMLSPKRPRAVAYRGGIAHVTDLRPAPIPLIERESHGEGAVIVSGGTGALGREAALAFKADGYDSVVVFGSSVTDTPRSDELLEASGIVVERFDIADEARTREVVAEVRERYGSITGVVHVAGRPGAGYLHTKTRAQFESVFAPKAIGGLNLHAATAEDELDFFVLFSSIAALTADIGQSDYTAANRSLDALARHRARHGMPAVSVQWPAWREVGMAHRLGAVDEQDRFVPLDPDVGIDLLRRLINWRDAPAVIMPGTLQSVRTSTSSTATQPRSEDVRLLGLAHVDDIDRAVAAIWAECLGVDELDAHEDFEQLGGNSLISSQMMRIFDERFPGALDITDLFRYTTVSAQAEVLRERTAGSATPSADDQDDLDALLDRIERGELSIEESPGLI